MHILSRPLRRWSARILVVTGLVAGLALAAAQDAPEAPFTPHIS